MAKFNYSTHDASKMEEIKTYLENNGIEYEICKNTSCMGNTTFDIEVKIPFASEWEVTRAREVSAKIKDIL